MLKTILYTFLMIVMILCLMEIIAYLSQLYYYFTGQMPESIMLRAFCDWIDSWLLRLEGMIGQ